LNIKELWFKLDDKIRYLFVGGFNFCVCYFIYSFICFIFGAALYQYALAIGWALSSIVAFTTQRTLVFESKGVWYKEYAKCCITWFFSYLINAGLLEFTVKYLHFNVYLAQFVSNASAAIFTYILFKTFAFRGK
jgi:putative flippase GtrA